MPGARCRISDKNPLVLGRGFPEDFRHVPGAVAIVDDQTVSLGLEIAMGAKQGFGRWPLQEGARFGINGRTQKIVRTGVAHVELDRRVELSQLHQISLEERARLLRRLLFERFGTQLLHRTYGCDAEAGLLREAELQQNEKDPDW